MKAFIYYDSLMNIFSLSSVLLFTVVMPHSDRLSH